MEKKHIQRLICFVLLLFLLKICWSSYKKKDEVGKKKRNWSHLYIEFKKKLFSSVGGKNDNQEFHDLENQKARLRQEKQDKKNREVKWKEEELKSIQKLEQKDREFKEYKEILEKNKAECEKKWEQLLNQKEILLQKQKEENEKQKEENEKLKEENEKLKEENEKIKEENGKLKEEYGKLKEENEKQKEENEKIKEENEKLKEENGKQKNENEKRKKENEELKKCLDTVKHGYEGKEVEEEMTLIGLDNLGNTCYMNSILQCLAQTPVMQDITLNDQIKYPASIELWKKNGIFYAYKDFMIQYQKRGNGYRSIPPTQVKRLLGICRPQFSSYEQKDAFDCLLCLLSAIHDDINEVPEQLVVKRVEKKTDEETASMTWRVYEKYRFRSPFTKNHRLEGLLRIESYCIKCENRVNVLFDEFIALKVFIPRVSNNSITIETCLKQYVSRQELPNNKRNCNQCQREMRMREETTIFYAPETLIIAVDRFNTETKEKNETKVQPNLVLDLHDYCSSNSSHFKTNLKYELRGMSIHWGTATGGHYTAKVKCKNTWFLCNDSRTSPIQESHVENEMQGYVFFYQKIA